MLPYSIAPRRLIAEIGLLIDYISGRGTRTFVPPAPTDASTKIYGKLGGDPIAAFLRVCAGFGPHSEAPSSTPPSAEEVAACETLILTRDWLNSITSPVSGDTIAFSILAGRLQAGKPYDSDDATVAFPSYVKEARKMVNQYTYFRIYAAALTFAIFVTSAWSLFGYMALNSLADLRTRTELIEHEQSSKEAAINSIRLTTNGKIPIVPDVQPAYHKYIRYCSAELSKYLENEESDFEIIDPDQISFCSHKSDLTARRDAAYQTLNYWILGGTPRLGLWVKAKDGKKKADQPDVWQTTVTITDDSARAWLAVVAGCILPLLMAMLGSVVAVLRDYIQSIRSRILAPRDRRLYQIRLTLGIVAGASVGFFFAPASQALPVSAIAGSATSGALASAAALASTTNLSAPALGFMAGFAVDLFFQFLGGAAQLMFQRKE
jgi:hypothetical protein